MIIELHTQPTMKLEDFAEKYGLIMEIRERAQCGYWDRYYACFKDAEVMENGCLASYFGNGETPEAAMSSYAKRISGTQLAIGAYKSYRMNIDVPRLTTCPKEK
jgi:hypothetical protein